MALITFIRPDGSEHFVDAEAGRSLMEAAKASGVPGILADCGGACACATCHVYVRPEWLAHTGEPDGMETDMLEVADDIRSTSRLACQIRVTEDLDGMIVDIPAEQYLS